MHVTMSWKISAESPRWDEINDQLKSILTSYPWVRPLNNFYDVVKIASVEERDVLVAKVATLVKSLIEQVNLVVSPLMSGGRYSGWLPESFWGPLNERTG